MTGNMLHVSITDNGKGFDMITSKKGNGLQNIQYRVTQSGGTVSINSAQDKGTSISCNFPVTSIRDSV